MNDLPAGAFVPAQENPVLRRAQKILRGSADLEFEDRFVPDHDELKELITTLRSMGCKIVLIMGTWDFLHVGHYRYIRLGRKKAGEHYPGHHIIVLVGVDSDELTRSRKGPKRPIVPEDERLGILEGLRPIDILTIERNFRELPALIPHDVRVISDSTNDPARLTEQSRYCEHLVNLPPQAETSTTERYRRLAKDGGEEVAQYVRGELGKLAEGIERRLAGVAP